MSALTVMFTVLLQSLPKLLLFYQGQNNGICGTYALHQQKQMKLQKTQLTVFTGHS